MKSPSGFGMDVGTARGQHVRDHWPAEHAAKRSLDLTSSSTSGHGPHPQSRQPTAHGPAHLSVTTFPSVQAKRRAAASGLSGAPAPRAPGPAPRHPWLLGFLPLVWAFCSLTSAIRTFSPTGSSLTCKQLSPNQVHAHGCLSHVLREASNAARARAPEAALLRSRLCCPPSAQGSPCCGAQPLTPASAFPWPEPQPGCSSTMALPTIFFAPHRPAFCLYLPLLSALHVLLGVSY